VVAATMSGGYNGARFGAHSHNWDATLLKGSNKNYRHTVHGGSLFAGASFDTSNQPAAKRAMNAPQVMLECSESHLQCLVVHPGMTAPKGAPITDSSASAPKPPWWRAMCAAARAEQRVERWLQYSPSPATGFVGTVLGMGGLAAAEMIGSVTGQSDPSGAAVLEPQFLVLGSFAALSTLIFSAPHASFGRPRNTIGGHLVCVSIALTIHWIAEAIAMAHGATLVGFQPSTTAEKVLTPALGVAAMLQLQVVNPPAAACAFLYTVLPDKRLQGPQYLVLVLCSCIYMLGVQLFVSRVVARGRDALMACWSCSVRPASTPRFTGSLTMQQTPQMPAQDDDATPSLSDRSESPVPSSSNENDGCCAASSAGEIHDPNSVVERPVPWRKDVVLEV